MRLSVAALQELPAIQNNLRSLFSLLVLILLLACGSRTTEAAQVWQVWSARYSIAPGSTNEPVALTVDSAGDIYVIGSGNGGPATGTDYLTLKYSSSGSRMWALRYDGPGHGVDSPTALVVDSAGDVYVTGASLGTNGATDYATVRYSSGGQETWAARYDGPGQGEDVARALTLDNQGAVYVTGSAYLSTSTFINGAPRTDTAFATIKYSAGGTQVWARTLGTIDRKEGHAILFAASGQIVVAGPEVFFSHPIGSGTWTRLLEYTTDGTLTTSWNTPVPIGNASTAHVLLQQHWSGDFYLSESFIRGPSGTPTRVSRYTADRQLVWQQLLYYQYLLGLTTDHAGNCYVAGQRGNISPPNNQYATTKFSRDGLLVWQAFYGGENFSQDDQATAVAVNGFGNTYVTGLARPSNGLPEMTTLNYANSTNVTWETRLTGPSEGRAIGLLPNGNTVVAGVAPALEGSGRDIVIVCYADLRAVTHETSPGQITVAGTGQPGLSYRLFRSLDLVTWKEADQTVADTSGRLTSLQTIQTAQPGVFFRWVTP